MMMRQDPAIQVKCRKRSLAPSGPAAIAETVHQTAAPSRLPGGPLSPGSSDSVEAQIARLGHPYLQSTQRHSLAAQVGMVQGNQHLQRMVANLKQKESVGPASYVRTTVSTIVQRDDDSGAEWVAGGLERISGVVSGRWLFSRINAQMASWEATLDQFGEQAGGLPILGRVLLVPISLLFVILSAIVGLLNLLARTNIVNAELQIAARVVRAAAGQLSREQLERDAREVGAEAWNIIAGGFIACFNHAREGIREANAFRLAQAYGEYVLAALALVGIGAGLRTVIRGGTAAAPARGAAPAVPRARGAAPAVRPMPPRPRVQTVIRDVARAREIRAQHRGAFREGWSEETLQADWEIMRRPGDPQIHPPAWIDSNGELHWSGRQVGPPSSELVAQWTAARRAAELERARAEIAARGPEVVAERAPDGGPAILDVQRVLQLRDAPNLRLMGVADPGMLRNFWDMYKRPGDPATPPAGWITNHDQLVFNEQLIELD